MASLKSRRRSSCVGCSYLKRIESSFQPLQTCPVHSITPIAPPHSKILTCSDRTLRTCFNGPGPGPGLRTACTSHKTGQELGNDRLKSGPTMNLNHRCCQYSLAMTERSSSSGSTRRTHSSDQPKRQARSCKHALHQGKTSIRA